MSLTSEIKKFILNADMDVVGVAPASAFASEPEGHRATDALPNAKSVIVFGKRIADGVTQSLFRGFENGRKDIASLYGTHGYELAPNFVLFFATFNISQFIERTFGHIAVPLPCGPIQNAVPRNTNIPQFFGPFMDGLPFNIPKAAVAAGLGQFGWSNRVLSPEYGPRIKFSAIITSLELEYDKPYEGEPLCDPTKCRVCAECCPTHAIPEAPEGTKPATPGPVSRNRCIVAACGLKKKYSKSAPVDYVANEDPSDEELSEAFAKIPIGGGALDHYPKWLCDRCLAYCPVGQWKKRFADSGLTASKE